MFFRCLCRCHFALGERVRADGVDTRDPIAAAAACPVCIDRHCRALSDEPPSVALPSPVPPYPWPAEAVTDNQGDGDGDNDG